MVVRGVIPEHLLNPVQISQAIRREIHSLDLLLRLGSHAAPLLAALAPLTRVHRARRYRVIPRLLLGRAAFDVSRPRADPGLTCILDSTLRKRWLLSSRRVVEAAEKLLVVFIAKR